MKKFLSTTAMMIAMMIALSSSTCSGSSDDEDDYGGGANGNSSLTLTTSGGTKYVLLSYHPFVDEGDNINGNLADDASIYWYMTPQNSWSPRYVYILLSKKMSISDFPNGYDLGEPKICFGMVRSRDNEYKYSSGSIKVLNNDGKSFTLEFNDYTASKSSGASITLNGTLYVEKQRLN